MWLLVFVAGVYGGYFGAAQGVLLMAILGIGLTETMQRNNATKNVLAMLVNLVAAVAVRLRRRTWTGPVAGLIAVGSVIGGQIGATVGRRLPSWALRGVHRGGRRRRAGASSWSSAEPPAAQSVKQIARNRASRSAGTADVSSSTRS